MNNLISIMGHDMKIVPFENEADESFSYRVIYSALGLWCLNAARSENENIMGISKRSQKKLLYELLMKYTDMCPETLDFFNIAKKTDVSGFIRNVYEQTGYLRTLENGCNVLNNNGMTLKISDSNFLYFGLPSTEYLINGLGIHCSFSKNEVKIKDYLVRDELTPEEYINNNFDECDFYEWDERLGDLEYFNPFYYGNISSSWHGRMKTKLTMARKSKIGPYYRVIKREDGALFYLPDVNPDNLDDMTGAEFRRIYVALKHYYENPMQLLVCPIDEVYSYLRILGQLPNREYFYLLMNAWPRYGFSDRNNFIIRNELVAQVSEVLGSIGFITRNGEFYG